MNKKESVKKSKFLSLVLRHQPETIGLTLDKAGWVDVTCLLQQLDKYGGHMSLAELDELVETDNKQRYHFSADKTRIRASQGHSINIDLDLKPSAPPAVLYHGTASRFMASILREGLLKGSRHHVHLSTDKETALAVGKRHGLPVILQIAAKRMQRDGFSFYCSDNGVWLVEHVPPAYFEHCL